MDVRKRKSYFLACLSLASALFSSNPIFAAGNPPAKTYDICVYGGTASGVIAAYTAKKMGKTVLLVEPGKHLGGMTSGGLGATDIGNKFAVTGLSRDFYRRIGQHHDRFEQWTFEPHVAENILGDYIKKAGVPVLYGYRIIKANNKDGYIRSITLESSDENVKAPNNVINAKMFIDCSYEGDLMAKAGVKYSVGREANSQYNETYNGVQLMDKHQFPDGIDPYKTPGNPASGLLWGISGEKLDPNGTGDKKLQAYNYRMCLTSDPANRIPITKPDNYNPEIYELIARVQAVKPWKQLEEGINFNHMPNHKTDINNNGYFSSDMIGMNYDYPEASYKTRKEIVKAHEDYTKGLLYYIGNDSRVPQHIRTEMQQWGYPKDEYTDNGNWSFQLYIREARRMVGDYVMTQANCEGGEVVNDGIGMAAYTMDSHNCQRVVVNGMVKNEGDVQVGGFGPYPIAYRSLIPKANECKNLLVPVCLSATHIAYGSIRMEPVFMVLGQSAAVAAAMAITDKKAIQDINITALQQKLKNDPLVNGSAPEVLVDDADKSGITTTGDWKTIKTRGNYGSSLTYSTNAPGNSIKLTPQIKHSGRYTVYYHNTGWKDKAAEVVFTIPYAGGQKTVQQSLKEHDGEWISLGTYDFKENAAYPLTIGLPAGINGSIVADAVLWVPETSN
jgi:hypothetical protein